MLAKPERRPPAGYPKLHVETPLVYSKSLSDISGHNVYIKLETKQLTGSFKPRGVGRSCYAAVQRLAELVGTFEYSCAEGLGYLDEQCRSCDEGSGDEAVDGMAGDEA